MKTWCAIVSVAVSLSLLGTAWAAEPATIKVDAAHPGAAISPMLYGLMTEEINHSYDGGLYAELIQNRAFNGRVERDGKPAHWILVTSPESQGVMSLDKEKPLNSALPASLRLEIKKAAANQRVGVANDGYWGIPLKPGLVYTASFYARASAEFHGPLNVSLESEDGTKIYGSAPVEQIGGDWKKYTAKLTASAELKPSTNNRFVISTTSPGTVWLGLVSLFPPTYKERGNGNRVDLMEHLSGMKPAFLRFPGGNYLEGDTIKEHFEWKKTIGAVEERPGHRCCWGYPSSDGLGLMEFLYWCEDLNMEPLLAVFAGYALKGEHVEKPEQLKPFIEEAIDEIEFVTGAADTTWGRKRAELGHPAPFKLRYVEIGNEDYFDKSRSYDVRFTQFHDAIKAKYPQLQLIATAKVKSRKPDVIDDHYYRNALAMERDVHHYDRTDRGGPKIFVGEWATTEGRPTPTLHAALGDAAWMTGMERNSDVVVMACYAPLLVNVNKGASEWGTNLIGYDAINSYGSASYYAQAMFAQNRGDVVLPATIEAKKLEFKAAGKNPDPRKPAEKPIDPLYVVASRDKQSSDIILKVVNVADDAYDATISIDGAANLAPSGKAIVLTGQRGDQNSLAEPKKVFPREETVQNVSASFHREFGPRSITVLRLGVKQ